MTVQEKIKRQAKESPRYSVTATYAVPEKFYELSQNEYSLKRALDITLSLLGLLACLFIFPLIAICIKLSSKGPIFFGQHRTGMNGRSFKVLKFRTMRTDYDKIKYQKPAVTEKEDIRIYSFGKFLRKSNLDELPQLINVLKGDMSLVGPRPYMEEECIFWNRTFDDFYYRYSVRPGLSGLAQVNGYRGGTLDEEHMRKRLDFDLIYVEKQSLALDLKIIFKTVLQMLHLNTNAH